MLLFISPFILLVRLFQSSNYSKGRKLAKNKSNAAAYEYSYKGRMHNTGYDKLFFSLIGQYIGDDTEQITQLKSMFENYELFAFPIIYDYDSANKIIFRSKLRSDFKNNSVALFIFNTTEYFDPPEENSNSNLERITYYPPG